tara:strand:+ start:577 stop:837 length:261 start_codon:yes stop_codon:yes gene_type:complete
MEKQKLIEVKVLMLISIQIFQECLDELKETTDYRQMLKRTSKSFDKELQKSLVKQIDALYDNDKTIANDIINDIIKFSEERVNQLK